MKNFFTIIFVLTIFFIPAKICAAADIWVAHWNEENVDIYVVEETISGNSAKDYFSVSTKEVRGGQLLQNVKWEFSKFQNDMWRYETSTMDGTHTTVVIPRNMIFEFCMNRLGWNYKIVDFYYY